MEPPLAVIIQLADMLLKIGNQRFTISGPGFKVTKRVYMQTHIFNTQFLPKTIRHHDHFSIDIRAAQSKGLGSDLMKLAITSFLWPFRVETWVPRTKDVECPD